MQTQVPHGAGGVLVVFVAQIPARSLSNRPVEGKNVSQITTDFAAALIYETWLRLPNKYIHATSPLPPRLSLDQPI